MFWIVNEVNREGTKRTNNKKIRRFYIMLSVELWVLSMAFNSKFDLHCASFSAQFLIGTARQLPILTSLVAPDSPPHLV